MGSAMRIAKAIAGAVVTFGGQVLVVLADDQVSWDEWPLLYAAGLALLTGLGVYVAPANRPAANRTHR